MIRFDNVSKTYPKQNRPALSEVSLEIEKGEFVFLVGSSGSGKSTFLRLCLREERPSTGEVHVLGKDLGKLSNWKVPHMRRQLGTVFQDFRLLPNKTVAQNVAFALEVIGKPKSAINKVVPEVLDLVGLGGKEERMPGELSGGEQQRVAIARAFVNRPMLLIADEPTGNLDPQNSVGIMKLLDRINRTGTTVLMATHDQAIVDQMRKRVIELDKGLLVRDQARGVYGYQHQLTPPRRRSTSIHLGVEEAHARPVHPVGDRCGSPPQPDHDHRGRGQRRARSRWPEPVCWSGTRSTR